MDIAKEAEAKIQAHIDDEFVKEYMSIISCKREAQQRLKDAKAHIESADTRLDKLVQAYADGEFDYIKELRLKAQRGY